MGDRRRFLKSLSFLPSWAFWGARGAAGEEKRLPPDRDYFKELGVTPIVNGAGTFTRLTASLMPPEVVRAIEYAARHYVRLDELQDRVGERIAALLGCEAAMVSSGAAGALSLGTAACLTGTDADRIKRLPDTTGMKNEVIVQKSHRSTHNPARQIRRPELGTLRAGSPADVAVLSLRTGDFGFVDVEGGRMKGTQKLECEFTLRDGKVVWDLNGISRPSWEKPSAAGR